MPEHNGWHYRRPPFAWYARLAERGDGAELLTETDLIDLIGMCLLNADGSQMFDLDDATYPWRSFVRAMDGEEAGALCEAIQAYAAPEKKSSRKANARSTQSRSSSKNATRARSRI